MKSESACNRIAALFRGARSRVIIVSAFIGAKALEQLLDACVESIDKTIFVRWRLDDILSRATDPHIYDVAHSHGAKLMCNQDLHAKAYIADDIALVGSANATFPGLGLAQRNNIEVLADTTTSNPDVVNLLAILESQSKVAMPIPQELLDKLYAEQAVPVSTEQTQKMWLPTSLFSTAANFIENGIWDTKAASDCISLGIPFGSSASQLKALVNNSFVFRQISEHMKERTIGMDLRYLLTYLGNLNSNWSQLTASDVTPLHEWINTCANDMMVIDETTDNPKILPYGRI